MSLFDLGNITPCACRSTTRLRASTPGETRVVATSAQDVFDEFLRNNQNADAAVEGRLVYQ